MEKGEEERKRIEEQLTEAMIRECWKCKVKYYKEQGCKMCYLCKQPVKDYTHFYDPGALDTSALDNSGRCPISTDTKKLHKQEVAKAAEKAKEELKKKNIQLKHDPTAGVALPAGGKKDKDRVAFRTQIARLVVDQRLDRVHVQLLRR